MGKWRLAIIAGTGASGAVTSGKRMSVPTRFGVAKMLATKLGGADVLLVSRHCAGHHTPPHKVEYRAFAEALRLLGCPQCVGTAAVGSLREDWPAGTLALPIDILDLSARNLTMYPDEVVHTDFTHPFDPELRAALLAAAPPLTLHDGAVYVNANGPRFESPAEIRAMRTLGGDVIGMTAGSEAVVMHEAGIKYAVVCAVTNLAAGLSQGELTHGEVTEAMQASMSQIFQIFERLRLS